MVARLTADSTGVFNNSTEDLNYKYLLKNYNQNSLFKNVSTPYTLSHIRTKIDRYLFMFTWRTYLGSSAICDQLIHLQISDVIFCSLHRVRCIDQLRKPI